MIHSPRPLAPAHTYAHTTLFDLLIPSHLDAYIAFYQHSVSRSTLSHSALSRSRTILGSHALPGPLDDTYCYAPLHVPTLLKLVCLARRRSTTDATRKLAMERRARVCARFAAGRETRKLTLGKVFGRLVHSPLISQSVPRNDLARCSASVPRVA